MEIVELTAIIGVKPSTPSAPFGPVGPVGPVAPVAPVAPVGIVNDNFLSEEDQVTLGDAVGFTAVTVTDEMGELSTAPQLTAKTPALLKVIPLTLSVPEHESLLVSKVIVGPSKLLGITILNFPAFESDTDAEVPEEILTAEDPL